MKKTVEPCCITNLNTMLFDLVNIFNKSGIHYWLDWGALLGIVRSGEIIPYDKDIDFGIFDEEIDKYNSLKQQIEERGYLFYPIIHRNLFSNDNFMPRVHFKDIHKHCYNLCACDIYVWARKGVDNRAVLTNCKKFIHCDSSLYDNPEQILWRGLRINVPRDVEKYLEMRYGQDWKEPDPDFYKHRKILSQ